MTDTAPAVTSEQPERQVRTCSACGQTDDHPRHIIVGFITYPDPATGKEVTEDKSIERHLDCCSEAGCDSGLGGSNHCSIVLKSAGDKRGLALADHIQAKPADLHSALKAAGYEVED